MTTHDDDIVRVFFYLRQRTLRTFCIKKICEANGLCTILGGQGEYSFQAFNRIARSWSKYQVSKLRKELRKAEEKELQDWLNHERAVLEILRDELSVT
jgi:hypothetical protein